MKHTIPYHKRNGTRAIGLRVDGRPDERGKGAKRAKALIAKYTKALGGEHRLNIGEAEAIRRAANLTVLVERQEAFLAADDPRYNADHHLRGCGNLKRIIDDLDLPKKRRPNSGNGDAPEYADDPDAPRDLYEFLEQEAQKPGFGKPISAAEVCTKKPKPKRKRQRLQ